MKQSFEICLYFISQCSLQNSMASPHKIRSTDPAQMDKRCIVFKPLAWLSYTQLLLQISKLKSNQMKFYGIFKGGGERNNDEEEIMKTTFAHGRKLSVPALSSEWSLIGHLPNSSKRRLLMEVLTQAPSQLFKQGDTVSVGETTHCHIRRVPSSATAPLTFVTVLRIICQTGINVTSSPSSVLVSFLYTTN